jgi:hypothetical protein
MHCNRSHYEDFKQKVPQVKLRIKKILIVRIIINDVEKSAQILRLKKKNF